MLKPYLHRLLDGHSLGRDEMHQAMSLIMDGQATSAQLAAFLVALRMKGETLDEIVGAASVLADKVTRIRVSGHPVIDTCGTGGDHSGSFNISTTVAFVLAGAGAVVAKHGNHSNTSSSGSADVLKALGVVIDAPVPAVEACMQAHGIGFLYAPLLHTAMKHATPTRRELGIRSLFNIIGPLANPAQAEYQLMGVYHARLIPALLPALEALGRKGAMVVHGEDGLDELTTCGITHVGELIAGETRYYQLDARELGLARASREDLLGGMPADNAAITRRILEGEPGPKRDIVLLNAAAGLRLTGLATDWEDGLAIAAAAIDDGSALAKLDALVKATRSAAETA